MNVDDYDDNGGKGLSLKATQDEGKQSIQGSNDEFGDSLVGVESPPQDELPEVKSNNPLVSDWLAVEKTFRNQYFICKILLT